MARALAPGTLVTGYTPLFGSMMTGGAFNLAAGALMLKQQIRYAAPVTDNPHGLALVDATGPAEIKTVRGLGCNCYGEFSSVTLARLPERRDSFPAAGRSPHGLHPRPDTPILPRGLRTMTVQEIETTLIQGISAIRNRDAASIDASQPFHDMGIDSLGFVEILVFIEKTFQLELIASDLARKDFETIHSLAAFIHRNR